MSESQNNPYREALLLLQQKEQIEMRLKVLFDKINELEKAAQAEVPK